MPEEGTNPLDDRATGENRWNTMTMMRKALGLPLGNDGISEFLLYWDSLNPEERSQLRRMDLAELNTSNIPLPKENS